MTAKQQTLSGEFISKNDEFSEICKTVTHKFNHSQEIIQKGRNILKKITIDNEACVIKAFFVPKFPQNYSYGLISKSKAKKSFDNAKRLLKLGFNTPPPIGYFEYRALGKLKESFYICKFAANTKTLHSIITESHQLPPELIKEFAQYSLNLHTAGILHRDFNPKNILVTENKNTSEFSLVDINRITWSPPLSLKESMSSLSRLPLSDQTRSILIKDYASLAEVSPEKCLSLLKQAENKTQRYFRNKKRLRKIFPKK